MLEGKYIFVFVLITLVIVFMRPSIEKEARRTPKTSIARLELIWPNILGLPEKDRGVLAVLSRHCQLWKEPFESDAVIPCLRRAVIVEPIQKYRCAGCEKSEELDMGYELERLINDAPAVRG